MVFKFRGLFKPKANEKSFAAQVDDKFERAQALQRLGDPEAAIRVYDELIAFHEGHAEAHYKRANALNGLGRWESALAGYDRAIELHPAYANALCNRGAVLERLGRRDDALASYDAAIALNPGDALVYYNRGSVLKELKQFEEALASYDQAIARRSDYAEAHINRGHVLQALRRYDQAVASYDRAIALNATYVAAFQGRAVSLLELGRLEDAISSYNQALALNPEQHYLLGLRRHVQMRICDWTGLDADLDRLTAGVKARKPVCPPFQFLSLLDSGWLQRWAAETWMREECPPDDALGELPRRPPRERIRVGYFSADFRSHPVSLLTAEVFESHDRSKFEINAFAFGPEANDPVRSRLERTFDRFLDVRDRSDEEVASLARDLGIDIAVDLGGYTEHCRTRIFALGAAPLQVGYLGYPGTMGADYMDYLIGDRVVVPEASQRHFSEKIVYLPDSFLPHDSTRSISDAVFTREELGLPPTAFVFCCFNNSYKITPATFDSWMRILGRVEGSVLWLSRNNPAAAVNLRREASRRGIDPQRLIFATRMDASEDHLARHRAADLFLDTLPYNAHATALDALWAGLPVLTLIGEAFAGRVGASLLTAIDLPELITSTPAQYEELAVQLAQDRRRAAEMKQKLARNRSAAPLFDTDALARHLEAGYAEMLARYQADLPPDHITVCGIER